MPAITVVGNISEPKLEYGGPQNKARCTFSIAENHSRFDKDKNDWVQTGTTWYRVTLWEAFAENVAEAFEKGSRVLIEGRSYTRSYEKDGEERTSFELHVNNIGKAISKRPPQQPQNAPQGQQGGFGGQSTQQPAADPWGGQPSTGAGWDTPASQPAAWDQPAGGNQSDEPPF